MYFISAFLIFYFYISSAKNIEIESTQHLRIAWEEYKQKYNKIFNITENEKRFLIFSNNVQKIAKLNAKNTETVFEMNHFGHLTDEEFLKYVNRGLDSIPKIHSNVPYFRTVKGDYEDIDWREKGIITPVKDQGECASCWAFNAIGQLESQYALRNNKTIILSEQDLVDCSKKYGNNGCDGGITANAFNYIRDNGINSEEDYPYQGKELECGHNAEKSILNVDKIIFLPHRDEKALASWVYKHGPVTVAIHASLKMQFYRSGIFYDEACTEEFINHGVLVVGIGSSPRKHYIVKNSWGKGFGMNGYILIARDNDNTCGIASYAAYATIKVKK